MKRSIWNRKAQKRADEEERWTQSAPPVTSEEQISAIYRLMLNWTRELEKSRITEYTQLLNRPWRLIWLNVLSGTARGVGIAIGFTFFAATIIYVLQILGALNLPIIGDYIADIVRIVQRQLELNTY
ncbi:DUF5665 domain-containing protein [Paenibacillus sp. M1]|uniref:DUF5665 domain-containing protein n=1 Tax=Paenibacillus haidiansis TaxID=1574488 RepID=A0ABU7VP39_9BACL